MWMSSRRLEGEKVSRSGMANIHLDLLLDYAPNVEKYPKFQDYFRAHQPPLLAVRGEHAPFFFPAGAEAWKRDVPQADVRFYNTGHFALWRGNYFGNPRILEKECEVTFW